jgi:PAS domain S-box-containing protein
MFPEGRPASREPRSARRAVAKRSIAEITRDALLGEYAPASVLINRHRDILYIHGDAGLYLTTPPGAPTHNLLDTALPALRGRLRAVLNKAMREQTSLSATLGKIPHQGGQAAIGVRVAPVAGPHDEPFYLVSFENVSSTGPAVGGGEPGEPGELSESAALQQLETELASMQDDLRGTIEELESANEELRASNEEMMSMNEELQSTNEELETSKEELESLNEELNTVNSQLQDKLEEVEVINNDLANLLESTDLATVFLDRDLNIKRFTPAVARLMNVIDRDIGRPITDIVRRFDDDALIPDARAVLASRDIVAREIRTDTGEWYARRVLPYQTADNRVQGVVVTFANIDVQKRAEKVLQRAQAGLEQRVDERTRELEVANHALRQEVMHRAQAERRLQSIVDTAVDGIISIDERGTIESCNRAAELMFQYTASEMVGQNVKMLMPQPYMDEHDGYLARYMRTGEPRIIGFGREVRGRRKDGSVFPMDLAVGEQRGHASGVRFTGVVRDISDRKRLEEEYRQAQKMEAVGRLSSGIAHDFNNLLMGVMGCADYILRHIEASNPARAMTEELKRAVEHGAQITRRLLTFTRKHDLAPDFIELDAVIGEMRPMLAQLVGEAVELHTSGMGTGKRVLCDRGLMEQVILNLVVNARDALDNRKGGQIRITVTAQRVDQALARSGVGLRPGPYLVLAVADNGQGMDADTRARIFEPFFTTKPESRGTGLGLSTVYGVVEQCGGHIDVDSEPGKGTTFRIYLPEAAAQQVASRLEAGVPAAPAGGDECVLLAEDEILVRQAARIYLESAGYRVLDARDGHEAVTLWNEHRDSIDLVVTDIVLPRLSGTEIARHVRADRPNVPVVFMSAFPEQMLLDEGHVPPGARPLQKPFTQYELLHRVREMLDHPDAADAVDGNVGTASEAASQDAARPEGNDAGTEIRRILLVEDAEIARKALCDLLELEGYEVLDAASVAQAEERCRQDTGPIDAVVTDIRLPDGTGVTLARTVKQRWPGAAVLFVSGYSREHPDVAAALEVSGARFVQKPVDLDALLRALDRTSN